MDEDRPPRALRPAEPGPAVGALRALHVEAKRDREAIAAAARSRVVRWEWWTPAVFPTDAPLGRERRHDPDPPPVVGGEDPAPAPASRVGRRTDGRIVFAEGALEAAEECVVVRRPGGELARYLRAGRGAWDVVVERLTVVDGVPVEWASYAGLDAWSHETYRHEDGRLAEVVRTIAMAGGPGPMSWHQRCTWSEDLLVRVEETRAVDPLWPVESVAGAIASALRDEEGLGVAVLSYSDEGVVGLAGLVEADVDALGGTDAVEAWSSVPEWPGVREIELPALVDHARPGASEGTDMDAYAASAVALAFDVLVERSTLDEAEALPLLAAIPVGADDPDAPARAALVRHREMRTRVAAERSRQAEARAARIERRRRS